MRTAAGLAADWILVAARVMLRASGLVTGLCCMVWDVKRSEVEQLAQDFGSADSAAAAGWWACLAEKVAAALQRERCCVQDMLLDNDTSNR